MSAAWWEWSAIPELDGRLMVQQPSAKGVIPLHSTSMCVFSQGRVDPVH